MDDLDGVLNLEDPRTGGRRSLCNAVRIAYNVADPNYQLRVWINGEGPDTGIERFLDGYALAFGFSDKMLERLKAFVQQWKAFDWELRGGTGIRLPENIRDADIVALREWKAVSRSAAEFLNLAVVWLEANCSDTPMFEGLGAVKRLGARRIARPTPF